MYRVAICDDEPHAAEQNEAMLCHILEDRNLKRDIDYSIHCFSSPVPLLAQMEKQPSAFHLLLLDIKLKNDNGLSLAAHLREIDADCSIIRSSRHIIPSTLLEHALLLGLSVYI